MHCASCGAANANANRFCANCGAQIASRPASSISPAEVNQAALNTDGVGCPVCGRHYDAGVRFCEDDGNALIAGHINVPPPPAVLPEVVLPPSSFAAEPSGSESPQSQMVVEPVELICPTCGLRFPVGTRFCDQDGSALGGVAAGMEAHGFAGSAEYATAVQATDEAEFDTAEPRRRWFVVGITLVLIAIVSGVGYAYWSGQLNYWLGRQSNPDSARKADKPVAKSPSNAIVAGLSGSYFAHLSDQDVTLSVLGDLPRPLVSAASEISYHNTVNGAACVASLVPVKGGGVGGDTGNAVSFRQAAVTGKDACPADIPVKIDISGHPADPGGVVRSVSVEWLSPDRGRILMSGTLNRVAPH